MNVKIKKAANPILAVLILSLVSSMASFLIILYSGNLIAAFGQDTLGSVFSEINASAIFPAFPVPLVIFSLLYFVWCRWLSKKPKSTVFIIFFVIIGIVVFLLVTLLTVWLSSVNGIRVGSVISSLIRGLKHGLADELQVIS